MTMKTASRSLSALAFVGSVVAIGALVHCGGGGSPTQNPTTVPTTAATTTTTLASGIVLPSGMTCSPTPPPLYGMSLKVHANQPGRYVLDSKPLVHNIDNYCERVVGVSGRFCDTRLEGDPQRTACDWLAVGKARNGRWGPDWYRNHVLCGETNPDCNDHPTEQFMAIAKAPGFYEACAAENARVPAGEGRACGPLDVTTVD